MLILAIALQSQPGAPARLRNYRGAPLFDRIRTLTPATDILARPAPGLIFPAEYANPCHPVRLGYRTGGPLAPCRTTRAD